MPSDQAASGNAISVPPLKYAEQDDAGPTPKSRCAALVLICKKLGFVLMTAMFPFSL